MPTDKATPLHAKRCGEIDFQLYTLAPVQWNGWALLGELNKWVSVSTARFSNLVADDSGLQVRACVCVCVYVRVYFRDC